MFFHISLASIELQIGYSLINKQERDIFVTTTFIRKGLNQFYLYELLSFIRGGGGGGGGGGAGVMLMYERTSKERKKERKGGGVLWYFHTYVCSGHFLGVQHFDFQYFWGFFFRKMNIFWLWRLCVAVEGFLGIWDILLFVCFGISSAAYKLIVFLSLVLLSFAAIFMDLLCVCVRSALISKICASNGWIPSGLQLDHFDHYC